MAVSENDFVNVESGTDETYVALDQEIEVYDVEEAIDDINGSIVNGNLEQKVDYLADTKDMIRQAIINKGQPVEENASFRSYADSIGELTGEINNQDVLITENGTYEAESGYTGLGEVTVEVQPALQDKVITQNGTYRADTGYDGLGNVVVNTPVINNQDKTITENGVYTADSGYSGLGEITVEVPAPEPTLDTLTATANGNYTPPTGIDGYDEVVVNVQPALQDKTITENGTYSADSGFYGLGEVVVSTPEINNQDKRITANGTYTADQGYSGLGEVVVSVADIPAVIDPLSVTPSTSQQVITASSGIDGFSPITVAAVTSAIDSNIQAGNIKSGVSILGVAGSVEELHGLSLTVTPSTSDQLIQPQGDYNAFDDVFVNAVDSTIDSNIQSANIVSGVSILGVNGSATVLDGETVSITPTTSQQVITPTSPHNGITQATVAPVTSAIDSNIVAGNIRRGIRILGVTGNMDPVVNETKTITTNGTYVPSSGYTGFGQITVNVGSSSLNGSFQPYSVSATNTLVLGTRLPDTTSSTPVSFVGINDIGSSTLYRAYIGNTNITGPLDMSSLTQITGYQAATYAFSGTAITSVDMSRITMITGYFATSGMFQNCTQLTSFDLSALEEVSGSAAACSFMFSGCTGLTSANLSALRIVTSQGGISNMFDGCVNLASVNLSSLEDLTGLGHLQGTFKNCRALTSLSFPALTPSSFDSRTSHFVTMCEGIPNITIHFPASVQSIIESEQGYSTTAPFGATSGTVLFDL